MAKISIKQTCTNKVLHFTFPRYLYAYLYNIPHYMCFYYYHVIITLSDYNNFVRSVIAPSRFLLYFWSHLTSLLSSEDLWLPNIIWFNELMNVIPANNSKISSKIGVERKGKTTLCNNILLPRKNCALYNIIH